MKDNTTTEFVHLTLSLTKKRMCIDRRYAFYRNSGRRYWSGSGFFVNGLTVQHFFKSAVMKPAIIHSNDIHIVAVVIVERSNEHNGIKVLTEIIQKELSDLNNNLQSLTESFINGLK